MQQKNIKRKQQIYFLTVGMMAAWVCIVLCLVQLTQVRAQLREQKEQISYAYNILSLYCGENAGASEGSDVGQDIFRTADLGHDGAGEEVIGTLELSYPEKCGLDYVERPQDRTDRQVMERLEELGKQDERIAAILRDSGAYPARLLEALANNPEMADFVEGWPTAEHKAAGGLTNGEKKEEFPLFLQWDPRWGYAPYGDNSCIAVSGCGPTCLSMALYYLTEDERLTPDFIGDYSMDNGYYLPGTGTLWALMEDVAPIYGVRVSQPEGSEWEMKAALDQGAVLICSMKPGDFTAGGHFIVIYGYDQDGFLVNDPNCVARSRQSWSYEQISRQMKHLWVFE